MHSNRAALVRVRTSPNSLDDLIRDAMRNARAAESRGDMQQRDEYLWLVGELESIKRGAQR